MARYTLKQWNEKGSCDCHEESDNLQDLQFLAGFLAKERTPGKKGYVEITEFEATELEKRVFML